MKFNYKFRRLCGAYYGFNYTTDSFNQWGGSNLAYDSSGDYLVSAISNRIQVIDLKTSTVRTLPVEARSNIRCLDLSPDDSLLVVVDVKDYAMLINFRRGVVLHRFRLKKRTKQVKFSPNGQYIAFTQGKHVQIWYTPTHTRKEFSPMILHRTYTGQSDDIVCLAWSQDSSVLAAGSRDTSIRIWTVNTVRNFEPMTLANHKKPIVGVYLISQGPDSPITTVYSVSEDGTLVTWDFKASDGELQVEKAEDDPMNGLGDEAVDFFSGGGFPTQKIDLPEGKMQSHQLVGGSWRVKSRHYFKQDDAIVSSATYCEQGQLLAIGFSSGLFGIYEMPTVSNIHTLSVGSNQLVRSCLLNKTGEWLALGCPQSQQLLVWEWRSETYVLKQRGHAYGMRRMAYSPDGVVICTGGEDGKLKLWNATSGFCYVTLEKSHTAPITAVTFAKSSVVLSASLDGTVRAHDLHRYRTFRTFTSPTPVQFLSLACDPSGEIVCAGSTDPFHIYTWNMQTGKLLDVYTGHAGPVADLCFQPNGGTLVSASWDGTVRLWDLYKGNVATESLQHNSDVVCVSMRPDGKEICTGTIGGILSLWDVENAKLKYEIDGRKDIAGGRKMNDRMTADNNAASRYFTSICYSADGAFILAGGNSKYVCIYAVEQRLLVKKFQVTFNRSLDGVLDELNSKLLGEGGPIDDHAESDDETNYNAITLPGARRGDDGSRTSRVEVLTHQVSFSSTGREWAAVSGEGLHVYSLDEDMIFDPISLTEAVTPAAVVTKASRGEFSVALKMALHLNEYALVRDVLEDIPFRNIPHVARSIGSDQLERLLQSVARVTETSPHVEFYLEWVIQLLSQHGVQIEKNRGKYMKALRSLFKAIQTRSGDLARMGEENRYMLEFVHSQASLVREQALQELDNE